jgi:hypothetical protein
MENYLGISMAEHSSLAMPQGVLLLLLAMIAEFEFLWSTQLLVWM